MKIGIEPNHFYLETNGIRISQVYHETLILKSVTSDTHANVQVRVKRTIQRHKRTLERTRRGKTKVRTTSLQRGLG